MDTTYNERNRQQTERLTDDELARPLDGGTWTIAAALAHLAYWDGRSVGALEGAHRHGLPLNSWITGEGQPTNAARTPLWLTLLPREAALQAIAAAEAADRVIAALPMDFAENVAAERYRMLERAIHRAEHLDEIEQVLA